MADRLQSLPERDPSLLRRFIDMLDTTWAELFVTTQVNPAVVTGNITAVAASGSPTLVSDLVANTFQSIAGGTADVVTVRINSIAGGAATGTVSFFGTDDGVNLFPLSGLPIGGAIGSGSFVTSASAAGAWQVKGSAARTVYAVGTAVGAGATLNVSLSATPNQSRVTSVLRGSLGGSVSAAAGSAPAEAVAVQGIASGTPVAVSSVTVNPTSVLTRPADTSAYSVGDLIASNTTAGSVVVPSVAITRVAAGSGTLTKAIIYSNHTTGLSGVSVTANLWTAAPTYTNGDNGAYAPATGAAGYLGSLTGTFKQFGDGAAAVLTHDSGVASLIKLASGQSIYWDLQANTAFTPQSGKTFTLAPQVSQD